MKELLILLGIVAATAIMVVWWIIKDINTKDQ